MRKIMIVHRADLDRGWSIRIAHTLEEADRAHEELKARGFMILEGFWTNDKARLVKLRRRIGRKAVKPFG